MRYIEQPDNVEYYQGGKWHTMCVCEKMMDDMIARWDCPVHGKREPNYDAIFNQELKEAMEGRR